MFDQQTLYLFLLVIVTAGLTILLRAFPFIAFGRGREVPPAVDYLGQMLSPAAIAMLVVYCFAGYIDRRPLTEFYGFAELTAGLLVVGLQLWRKNPLLSICAGTIAYMLIVQQL